MSSWYENYLKSDHWKQLRKSKYNKSKFKNCHVCGDNKKLNLHHLVYKKNIKDTKVVELMILCERCHYLVHKLKDENKLGNCTNPLKIYRRIANILPDAIKEDKYKEELDQEFNNMFTSI
mgnify:CR=1 FL=1